MEFNRRLKSFLELKVKLQNIPGTELNAVIEKAKIKNPWFTGDNIKFALAGIISMLSEDKLQHWTSRYDFSQNIPPKSIGVIMAGNIPLVGFHDLLSVLISGHRLVAKLSSQDEILLPFVTEKLVETDENWKEKISFVDKLQNFDAVIATGSDNTSRYFDYYFKDYPKIIRKNRTSAAVLHGDEKGEELRNLGEDIYRYFGLGCRNVSKIYLPQDFDIKVLLDPLNDWDFLSDSHKFVNNYNYNRAIYAMEQIPYFDNGFSIFTESEQLVAPTSVVYYQYYNNNEELENLINANEQKLQCVVSAGGWFPGSIEFGKAQVPEVWDYADNIDTVKFLLDIK